MHGLPTIHKKEQLAADNQEANRILEQYGTKSDNPLPSAPARADIALHPLRHRDGCGLHQRQR